MPSGSAAQKVLDFSTALNGRGAGQSRLHFKSGEAIYSQGAASDAVFYLESGQIKIAHVSRQGKEVVLALRGAHEFFGEGCLLPRQRRLGTATALTDTVVVRITTSGMLDLVGEQSHFAEAFVVYLVRRHIRSEERIIDQLTHSAERRLARTLLQLANVGDRPQGELSVIPGRINQNVLAKMVGTTRSRVNFFMNQFKKRGLIEYDRSGYVRVCNAPLLELTSER
jgi:CRP/FNR family transcriptional regulator, cyclic AMP receptor protein